MEVSEHPSVFVERHEAKFGVVAEDGNGDNLGFVGLSGFDGGDYFGVVAVGGTVGEKVQDGEAVGGFDAGVVHGVVVMVVDAVVVIMFVVRGMTQGYETP